MVDYNATLYRHPQETWDEAKCKKLAKRVATDGMGTKYPFKGYVGDMVFVAVRYNGGCVREGQWYQGEEWPMPILPSGYKIVQLPNWGFRIVTVTT